jgi:hypothetical protein
MVKVIRMVFLFPFYLTKEKSKETLRGEKMTQPAWAIAAVFVVDHTQRPVYHRVFFSPQSDGASPAYQAVFQKLWVSPSDELRIHFLAFSSIDMFEEKSEAKRASGSTESSHARQGGVNDGRFMDKLLDDGRFRAFGFQGATATKVILVTLGDAPRDAVVPLCRSCLEAATLAMCDPFRDIGGPLGPQLDKIVQHLLEPYSATALSRPSN